LYYYLSINQKLFQLRTGSAQPMINNKMILNFEIPIPEDINTIKLYLDYLNPANQTLQTLKTLKIQKEKSICGLIKMLTSFGTNGVEWDEYRLGDVITMKSGKFNTKNMSNTGEYPFYNASINNPIGTHNEYCFDGNEYILFIKSGGNGQNRISETNGLALSILVKNKCATVLDVVKIDSNIINIKYLHYFIKINRANIQNNAKFTTNLGHVDMEKFKNIKLRVLKPHIMSQYKLQEEFDFMEKLKSDIMSTLKNQEDVTKQMMKLVLNEKQNDEIQDNQSEKSAKSEKSVKSAKSDNFDIPEELTNIPKVSKNYEISKQGKSTKSDKKKVIPDVDLSDTDLSDDNKTKVKTKKNKSTSQQINLSDDDKSDKIKVKTKKNKSTSQQINL